jgi:hypothetical protein
LEKSRGVLSKIYGISTTSAWLTLPFRGIMNTERSLRISTRGDLEDVRLSTV